MKLPKGLTQAYAMQDTASRHVLAFSQHLQDSGTAPNAQDMQALAALITAWDKAQERVRIHRRVPLPGTARPPVVSKRKVARAAAPANVHPSAPAPQPQPQPPSDVT